MPQNKDMEILKALGIEEGRRIYIVGGFLRDYVLGRNQKDIDFAVDGSAIRLAQSFARRIRGAFVLLDESFGCARVVKRYDEGTYTFDFADYRAATIEDDMRLRDFTVNALCLPLDEYSAGADLKGNIVDVTGGVADIQNRIVRMTNAQAFNDDPLRLMRAFSLKAQYGFAIDAATEMCIRKQALMLIDVSAERVRDEFFKVLSSTQAADVLTDMDHYGLLPMVIPQVRLMYNVPQGGYHHLDVWNHTLEAVRQFDQWMQTKLDADVVAYLNTPVSGERSRAALIRLALLLHDIGKPETKKEADGRMSFHSHEHVGKRIARTVAQQLKLSTKERHAVEDMVMYHLRPGYLSNFAEPSRKMIFRYFRDTGEEAVAILLLSLADQRATRGPMTTDEDQKHHEDICLGLVKEYFDKQTEEPVECLINGHDLIKELHLKPSPVFSRILREVEEQQGIGTIRTRDEALALARDLANTQFGETA